MYPYMSYMGLCVCVCVCIYITCHIYIIYNDICIIYHVYILYNTYVGIISHFSWVWLFVTLGTIVLQAPLSMGSSRQKYWSGLPFPPPGNLPDLGLNSCLLHLLHYRRILYHWVTREAYVCVCVYIYIYIYVCMYVCICIYTHIHTLKSTHQETY